MFYIHFRKVGGLRFLTIGRITVSWSVTSYEAWCEKIQNKMDAETFRALTSL